MDHFVQLAEEPSSDIDESKLPAFPASEQEGGESDLHLVIDARIQGRSWSLILDMADSDLHLVTDACTRGECLCLIADAPAACASRVAHKRTVAFVLAHESDDSCSHTMGTRQPRATRQLAACCVE